MLSTANYALDENIKRSGEELAPDLAELGKPGCKVYFHRVAGAITHMPDGAQISFRGGMFCTTNRDVQAFLDAIVDKPTSQVYTDKKALLMMNDESRSAALAAMVNPGDQKNAQGETDSTKKVNLTELLANPASDSSKLLQK